MYSLERNPVFNFVNMTCLKYLHGLNTQAKGGSIYLLCLRMKSCAILRYDHQQYFPIGTIHYAIQNGSHVLDSVNILRT